MGRVLTGGIPIFFVAAVASAQTSEPPLRFEVASVKPAAPTAPGDLSSRMSGGPGTRDPLRFTARHRSVLFLLMEAYGVGAFYISGPRQIHDDYFDIVATVPAGATREQFHAMLRNLLEERFGLKAHFESRETPGYALVVAKGGLKLPKTRYDTSGTGANAPPPGMSSFGRLVLPASPVSNLIGLLTKETDRPVVDGTGLTGRFDITLEYTPTG